MQKILSVIFTVFLTVVALSATTANAQILYAVDRTSNLYTIDPATGATTLIGPAGIDALSALVRDPISGVFYAATGGISSNNACIYTINTTTGAATLVGCGPNTEAGAGAIPGIAIRSDGTLFAILEGQDDLATIDKATSATTVIGDMGTSPGYGQGLTFTPTDTLLHSDGAVWSDGGDGAFWTTNQITGLDTLLSSYSFVDFPAFNDDARFTDMSFDQNGILYGLVYDDYDPAPAVYLATADPDTGAHTGQHSLAAHRGYKHLHGGLPHRYLSLGQELVEYGRLPRLHAASLVIQRVLRGNKDLMY